MQLASYNYVATTYLSQYTGMHITVGESKVSTNKSSYIYVSDYLISRTSNFI